MSVLCQMNGGCMGCCGHDFLSPEKIKEAVSQNTKEFEEQNPKVKAQFMKFRDREHPSNLRNGVCRNLIQKKGCIHCPLHPAIHKVDLRIGHCDTNYLCQTARKFETWHKKKQEKFLAFIESHGLDNITYSMMMDKGTLLEKFEN